MIALPDWLAARRSAVDVALERFLPTPPACPARVAEAMRYSVFAGGKRLRPMLALAAAEAVALAAGNVALGARADADAEGSDAGVAGAPVAGNGPRGGRADADAAASEARALITGDRRDGGRADADAVASNAGVAGAPGAVDVSHLRRADTDRAALDVDVADSPVAGNVSHLGGAQTDAATLDAGVASALEAALPAACALELIHTYSLIHDDLPAMDDDTLRRGRATSHVVYGEGLAILAGDALLTEAFSLLARAPRGGTPELVARKLETIRLIAEAAGSCGMVGGQAIDLDAAGSGAALDAGALQAMHARKTGALIRASAAAGAVMAGATPAQRAAIERYAEEVGLAFQIVDDVLDVEGVSGDLGKTAGKDAAAGKPTYPALFGLEASRSMAAACVTRALAALHEAGLSGQLPAIAGWVTNRSS